MSILEEYVSVSLSRSLRRSGGGVKRGWFAARYGRDLWLNSPPHAKEWEADLPCNLQDRPSINSSKSKSPYAPPQPICVGYPELYQG